MYTVPVMTACWCDLGVFRKKTPWPKLFERRFLQKQKNTQKVTAIPRKTIPDITPPMMLPLQ